MRMSSEQGPRDLPTTALVSLTAAVACVVGVRGVLAVEPSGPRPLLGVRFPAPETLGLVWSPAATWPWQYQAAAMNRMLGIVAALVLAGACVGLLSTLATLVEAGAARRRELAVRVAVGAAPATVARLLWKRLQVLLTSAGALGLVLGLLGGAAMRAAWPGLRLPLGIAAGAGDVVLALALLLLVAALAYGAAGLRLARGRGLAHQLGSEGRGGDDRRAVALRRMLASVQIGAAGTVVVVGLLLSRGVGGAGGAAAYDGSTVIMNVALPAAGGPRDWRGILDGVRRIPGVQAESLAAAGTLAGVGLRDYVTADCGACVRGGLPVPFWSSYADHYAVSPGFFAQAGYTIGEGRDFDSGDGAGSEPVAVINRTMANSSFEGGRPLGRRIRVGRGLDDWYTVVGIVEDSPATALGVRDRPHEAVYLSVLQRQPRRAMLLLEADEAGLAEVRSRLAEDAVVSSEPRTLQEHLEAAASPQRWAGRLAGVMAGLILVLAVAGTRALTLQITRRSAHDLAVRRALGAENAGLIRYVLAGSARSGLWGTAICVFTGGLCVGLLQKALGGLPTPGPLAYLAVASLLTATAVAASWQAAREATRVPPASVLE